MFHWNTFALYIFLPFKYWEFERVVSGWIGSVQFLISIFLDKEKQLGYSNLRKK